MVGSAQDIVPYAYDHSIDGISVAEGTAATDIVNTNPGKPNFAGTYMRFQWKDPADKNRRVAIVPLNKKDDTYIDTFLIPAIIGKWEIGTDEFKRIKRSLYRIGSSKTNFNVIQAPEFGKFGLVIPLLLAGIFYLGLRKKIVK